MTDPLQERLKPVEAEFQRAMQFAEHRHFRESLNAYTNCIKIAANDNIPMPARLVASILMNSGYCQIDLGDWTQGFAFYRSTEHLLKKDFARIRQLAMQLKLNIILPENDDLRDVLAKLYDSMGLGHDSLDEWEEAVKYYKESLQISQELKDYASAALTYRYIAIAYQRRERWANLQEAAERMLKLSQRATDSHSEFAARRFLAQAHANQGRVTETIAELERVVTLGKQIGHPEVATDEALLADIRGEMKDYLPHPKASYEQFSPHELFDKITVEVSNERSTPEPQFIIHTAHFDATLELLTTFQLSVLPVSLHLMRQMPLPPGTQIPTGGHIKLEWSLDDINPSVLVYEQIVPEKLHDALLKANQKSRRLTIVLRDSTTSKTEAVPGTWESYLLDWSGSVGISVYLRQAWREVRKQTVEPMIKGMESQIQFAGPVTGLYSEMGMLYRLIEDYQRAIECYHKEIKLGLKRDGLPGIGTARAFSNLGVVYKKMGTYDLALDSFRVALSLNPNYFECLISMSGLTQNANVSMALLARAYRIRAGDPIWETLFQNASTNLGLPVNEMVRIIEDLSTKVDLSSKTALDRVALKRLGF